MNTRPPAPTLASDLTTARPENQVAPSLRAEGLAIGYRRARGRAAEIASGLSMRLLPGELVCLLGPNGAGKSTLMRTLARLQPPWPQPGQRPLIKPDVAGQGRLARRLSIVLTDRVDVGALTGYGLVSLGRHPYTGWTGALTSQDREVIAWALTSVQAQNLADRPVLELSDGERQKILIARALAQEPMVMLLDEPTAFLDLPRRVEVMALLRRLAQENRQAILLSTHDLDLALRHADRLWLLGADGVLIQGAPEDLVLNGAFEQVFADQGVSFDRETGSFHTRRQTRGQIVLMGEGAAAFWTRRALERIGFRVVAPAECQRMDRAFAVVRVRETDSGQIQVCLEQQKDLETFTDIAGLIDWLRFANNQ